MQSIQPGDFWVEMHSYLVFDPGGGVSLTSTHRRPLTFTAKDYGQVLNPVFKASLTFSTLAVDMDVTRSFYI